MTKRIISYTFNRAKLERFFERYYGVSFKQDIPYIYLDRDGLLFNSRVVNAKHVRMDDSLFPLGKRFRCKLFRGDLIDPAEFLARHRESDAASVSYYSLCHKSISSFFPLMSSFLFFSV